MTKKTNTRQLIFVIPPNANLFDFAGSAQVFHEAKEQGLDIIIKFCTFENKLTTSTKIPLGKIENFKKIKAEKGDYIFITSADTKFVLSQKFNPSPSFLNWIVKCYEIGATVGSFCVGIFILAKTGLLNNKQCTTHFNYTQLLQDLYPQTKVNENIIYIEDKGIITSAGATSGIDVALYVLNKITNDVFTSKVARELVIYNRRNGASPQKNIALEYRNHVHAGIHKVQNWLQENLNKPVNMPDLAEIALMSERNFTRVFKKETQLTVNEYITILRKEKINELLKKSNLTREQIANQCGLQSVRHLIRLMHDN